MLIDDNIACKQWNRGIGFTAVVRDYKAADAPKAIATQQGYKDKVAGEITDKPEITFRGHTWTYNPT